MYKEKRPINLALTTMAYPPMAIASILHRISGVLLFILMPFALYILGLSLSSQSAFDSLHVLYACMYYRFLVWVFTVALIYHLLAGIRHIIGDFGLGEGLRAARLSAYGVMGLTVLAMIGLGVVLW